MGQVHIVENYTTMNHNELLLHTIEMNLTNKILSKRIQIQKHVLYDTIPK